MANVKDEEQQPKLEHLNDVMVYQANPLIESRKTFSMNESRLFFLGLQRLRPHLPNAKYFDDEFPEIHIDTKEIIELFGGNKRFYTELRKTCENMGTKAIKDINVSSDKNKPDFRVVPVFRKIEFRASEGLTICFNIETKPYLLELEDIPYTKFPLNAAFQVSSTHALRLLELLLQHKNMPTKKIVRNFTIEELRRYLNLRDDAYMIDGKLKVSSFKKNVIDKPIEEINKKTKYKVSAKTLLKGGRTAGYTITMERTEEAIEAERAETSPEENRSFLAYRLRQIGIKPDYVPDKLIQEYGERWIEHVLMKIEPLLKEGRYSNPGGFVRSVIEDKEEYEKQKKYWAEIDAAARMKERDDRLKGTYNE